MKTSTWIKLIGILCIIISVFGMLNSISEITIPYMTGMDKLGPKISPIFVTWLPRLGYLGIIVNLTYFLAGLFFLIVIPLPRPLYRFINNLKNQEYYFYICRNISIGGG